MAVMNPHNHFAALALLLTALCASAQAQTPATPAPARWTAASEHAPAADLREALIWMPVTLKDVAGRSETRQIPVTVYRPAGEGPFPLVVFNHGRATRDNRAAQGRSRPEQLARWLVRKGFVVMAPTRVGYADTFGDFDPELGGVDCKTRKLDAMHQAISDQVLATVAQARRLPYVNAARWVVMGVSAGGMGSMATVWRAPQGLVGGINFSGGIGGDPVRMPQKPCNPGQLTKLWGEKAASAQARMLWLYWENDQFWGPENPRLWHKAWTDGGAKAALHMLPPSGTDGHSGMNRDMDRWAPLAEGYLNALGFVQRGLPPRPPASGFAALDHVARVPLVSVVVREKEYRRFLQATPPRAFAIGTTGAAGWASGDWAVGRALATCERYGKPCRLYAIDSDVVWPAR